MPNESQTTISSRTPCGVPGVSQSAINVIDDVRCCNNHDQQGQREYVCVTGDRGVIEAQINITLSEMLSRGCQ
jgi:hypothetical protein